MPGVAKTVLIVEDGETLNKMLRFLFSARNYKVESAKNGLEALDLLESKGADLILLDLMMPTMDGYEFGERIKNDSRFNKTPVIVLSTLKESQNRDKLESMNIHAYVQKPFNSAELVAMVEKVLA